MLYNPRTMQKFLGKRLVLAAALIVIVAVGGLWVWDTYTAGRPNSDKPALVLWVDRGIQEGSLPIFLQRVEDLKAELSAADSEGRRDISIYLRLGNAYYTLGELGLAAENYREILRTHPQDGPAHENLAQALVEMGDFEGAENHWREAIRYSGTEQSYLKLAAFLTEQYPGRADEVLEILEAGVADNKQTPAFMVAIGNWYRARGQLEQAISHYEVADRLLGGNASIQIEIQQMREELNQKFLKENQE